MNDLNLEKLNDRVLTLFRRHHSVELETHPDRARFEVRTDGAIFHRAHFPKPAELAAHPILTPDLLIRAQGFTWNFDTHAEGACVPTWVIALKLRGAIADWARAYLEHRVTLKEKPRARPSVEIFSALAQKP